MSSTLDEVLQEIVASPEAHMGRAAEMVAERNLRELAAETGNDIIVYISGWEVSNEDPYLTMINHVDSIPFINLLEDLEGHKLDLIIHSPGGVVEVARSIVHMIRDQYEEMQVSVPHLAMSAATMIACAGDELHMASHSFLGPTDPQVNFRGMSTPALGIVKEFEEALRHGDAQGALSAYGPLIDKYEPCDLYGCRHAIAESNELVSDWLNKYLLRELDEQTALDAADKLNKHFRSHSRRISRDELRGIGFPIVDMEDNPKVKRLKMSVYYAYLLFLTYTEGLCKVISNHKGRKYYGRHVN